MHVWSSRTTGHPHVSITWCSPPPLHPTQTCSALRAHHAFCFAKPHPLAISFSPHYSPVKWEYSSCPKIRMPWGGVRHEVVYPSSHSSPYSKVSGWNVLSMIIELPQSVCVEIIKFTPCGSYLVNLINAALSILLGYYACVALSAPNSIYFSILSTSAAVHMCFLGSRYLSNCPLPLADNKNSTFIWSKSSQGVIWPNNKRFWFLIGLIASIL